MTNTGSVGETVLDFVERAAFGAGSRIEGGGIGAVASADVEAHDSADGLAGDRSDVADTVRASSHRGASERATIDGIKEGEIIDTVRIDCVDSNVHRLVRVGHDRGVG